DLMKSDPLDFTHLFTSERLVLHLMPLLVLDLLNNRELSPAELLLVRKPAVAILSVNDQLSLASNIFSRRLKVPDILLQGELARSVRISFCSLDEVDL